MSPVDVAGVVAALLCGLEAFLLWPWDWRGRRRSVKLSRARRWWE